MSSSRPRPEGQLFDLLQDRPEATLLVLSLDGIILHASPSAESLIGASRDSLVGKSLASSFLLQPTAQEPSRALLQDLPDGVRLRLSAVADATDVTSWLLQRSPLVYVLVHLPDTPDEGKADEQAGAHDEATDSGKEEAYLSTVHRICERACRVHRFDQWSEREREVVKLVAHGHTTKQIARELGISARTVDKHRDHVSQKAGVDSAAQLGHLYAFVEVLEQLDAIKRDAD